MESIILSIKPEFVNKIITGEKKYEFRRKICRKCINKIYIYATYPVKKVVAEVEVIETIVDDKETLWKTTKQFAGISKIYYNKYFEGLEQASAYHLGNILEYEIRKDIQEFGLKCAPQSFAYIKH